MSAFLSPPFAAVHPLSGLLTNRGQVTPPLFVAAHPLSGLSVEDNQPVYPHEFTVAMARCGPFERNPVMAMAVSGGRDSVALMLLARDWLTSRGGRGVVLTVNHGLRPLGETETEKVNSWAKRLDFPCVTLTCHLNQNEGNVQNAARQARYRVLLDWCRQAGIFHLLLAHQAEDQCETFLMRHFRGSGPMGMASMAFVSERPYLRLLRPLLGFPRTRLASTCRAHRQSWIEDPSNDAMTYERTRWRMVMPFLAEQGYGRRRLSHMVVRAGARRVALEQKVATLMALAVRFYPQGYAYLDTRILSRADTKIACSMMSMILRMISGAEYGPGREKVGTLFTALLTGRSGRTLHGCRLVPAGRQGWLICREWGMIQHTESPTDGERFLWDQRFMILHMKFMILHMNKKTLDVSSMVWARLGEEGWPAVAALMCQNDQKDKRRLLPYPVRLALPALWYKNKVFWVPHLDFRAPLFLEHDVTRSIRLYFQPRLVAASAPFACL